MLSCALMRRIASWSRRCFSSSVSTVSSARADSDIVGCGVFDFGGDPLRAETTGGFTASAYIFARCRLINASCASVSSFFSIGRLCHESPMSWSSTAKLTAFTCFPYSCILRRFSRSCCFCSLSSAPRPPKRWRWYSLSIRLYSPMVCWWYSPATGWSTNTGMRSTCCRPCRRLWSSTSSSWKSGSGSFLRPRRPGDPSPSSSATPPMLCATSPCAKPRRPWAGCWLVGVRICCCCCCGDGASCGGGFSGGRCAGGACGIA
mmetsp:Transcript_32432/g.100327  ORF Transcript_32432/g.100327 Transcript_32432/m.100327 type:complete len:261 (-) Transcript_32432:478-1260(-)